MLFRRKQNVKRATIEAERQARRLRLFHQLIWVMYLSLAVALVAGVVQLRRYLLTTPRLALQAIEVMGTKRSTSWEVQVLAELDIGRNLLTIDLEETARKIRRHPWVKQVLVRRMLPDRIQFEVTERQPVALLAMGDLYYIDADGSIFKKVRVGEKLGYPVLTGFDEPGPLQTGRIGRQAIREALELLAGIAARTKFTHDQISEIHLDPVLGYSVYTATAGAQIQLGWDQFDRKLERLVKLLDQQRLDLAQVRRIDMDLSRWAVVTPL